MVRNLSKIVSGRAMLAGLIATIIAIIIVSGQLEASMIIPGIGTCAGFMIGGGVSQKTLLEMITDAGLTSNLVLCLDAGDINSYNGTSQTWTDVSGAGHNFFLGSTSGAQASDPTFNGIAGNRSENEYFSFDGGDFLQETADHGFDATWHHNNAAFTIAAAVYLPSGFGPIFTNRDQSVNEQGLFLHKTSGLGRLALDVWRSTGVLAATVVTTSETIPDSLWAFVAVAINEATGSNGATLQINAFQESLTSTYSSPSSGSPGASARIGAEAGGDAFQSGSRLGCIAAWSTRQTDGNLSSLRTLLQARYTTMA